jgi:hypothetical protein
MKFHTHFLSLSHSVFYACYTSSNLYGIHLVTFRTKCKLWSLFLVVRISDNRSRDPGSISGTTRFIWKVAGLGHGVIIIFNPAEGLSRVPEFEKLWALRRRYARHVNYGDQDSFKLFISNQKYFRFYKLISCDSTSIYDLKRLIQW